MAESRQTQNRITVICECLSRSRRRCTLDRLREAEKPLALADLAEDVADWEVDVPQSEIDDETVKDVYMSLYHNHVQKLDDAGFVKYNQERNTVELAEYPEELSNKHEFLTSG